MSQKQIFFAYLALMLFMAFCGFGVTMGAMLTNHWVVATLASLATISGVVAIFFLLVRVAVRYQRSEEER